MGHRGPEWVVATMRRLPQPRLAGFVQHAAAAVGSASVAFGYLFRPQLNGATLGGHDGQPELRALAS
jgi:hypothetical protein